MPQFFKNAALCGSIIIAGHVADMGAKGNSIYINHPIEAMTIIGIGIGIKRGFGKTFDDVKAFTKQVVADESVVDRAIKLKNIKEMKARQA